MSAPRRDGSQAPRRPTSPGAGRPSASRKPATGGKGSTRKPAAARKPAAKKPPAKKAAARKPAARKPGDGRAVARKAASSRRPPSSRSRSRRSSPTARRIRAAAGGDRPYIAALVVLVVVVATMALGPLQNYTAAADRVESLESTRDQLAAQVDRLEDRRAQLSDPEELELIARSRLGLVMPGEVPFVVVTPDGDEGREQVRPAPVEPEPVDEGAWYRRLGRSLSDLFATDP